MADVLQGRVGDGLVPVELGHERGDPLELGSGRVVALEDCEESARRRDVAVARSASERSPLRVAHG